LSPGLSITRTSLGKLHRVPRITMTASALDVSHTILHNSIMKRSPVIGVVPQFLMIIGIAFARDDAPPSPVRPWAPPALPRAAASPPKPPPTMMIRGSVSGSVIKLPRRGDRWRHFPNMFEDDGSGNENAIGMTASAAEAGLVVQFTSDRRGSDQGCKPC
jgi:hypothetical protein